MVTLIEMCAGWVEDKVPDSQKKAAVKVHVWDGFPELSPLNMNCNAILGVSMSARLCSLSLTFSVLLVSPTYTCGQSLQGISYTTSVCFRSGVLFLHQFSFQSLHWS